MNNYLKSYFVSLFGFIKKYYRKSYLFSISRFFLSAVYLLFVLVGCAKTDQYDDTQINLSHIKIDSEVVRSFLEETLQDNPEIAEYHAIKGIFEAKSGNWRSASELLKKAIQLGDTTFSVRSWLIRSLVGMRNYKEAQLEVNLLKKGHEYPEFSLVLAEMYYNLQDFQKALEHINTFQKLLATNHKSQNLLALIQIQLADSVAAWHTITEILTQDSTYAPALLTAFQLSFASRKIPQAFHYARAYLAYESTPDTLFCTTFAQMWHLIRKYDTAVVWYEKAIQYGKKDIQAYLYAADYYTQRNNYARATTYLEGILKINRNTPQVYNRLGYAYEYYLDNLKQAEKYYILARAQTPSDTTIDRALRRVNYKIRVKTQEQSLPKLSGDNTNNR